MPRTKRGARDGDATLDRRRAVAVHTWLARVDSASCGRVLHQPCSWAQLLGVRRAHGRVAVACATPPPQPNLDLARRAAAHKVSGAKRDFEAMGGGMRSSLEDHACLHGAGGGLAPLFSVARRGAPPTIVGVRNAESGRQILAEPGQSRDRAGVEPGQSWGRAGAETGPGRGRAEPGPGQIRGRGGAAAEPQQSNSRTGKKKGI